MKEDSYLNVLKMLGTSIITLIVLIFGLIVVALFYHTDFILSKFKKWIIAEVKREPVYDDENDFTRIMMT